LFGARIRQERERRGMTAQQVADAAGVSWRQVARVELGRGSPTVLWLIAVARALEVPPGELLADFMEG
jgi:transcriptional regulator with XRE-family HTH domain